MPETQRLIEAVDGLHKVVDELAQSNQMLAHRFDGDQTFRRRVLMTLAVLSIVAASLAGWALYTTIEDRAGRCQRSNEFRTDLYNGVDAVLDNISGAAAEDPEVQAVFEAAKQSLRDELPLLEGC